MKKCALLLAIVCLGCKPSEPTAPGTAGTPQVPKEAAEPPPPPPDREPAETVEKFWADFKAPEGDPLELLRSLPVESVTVGTAQSEQSNPATVNRTYSGPGKVLATKDWKKFVTGLEKDGYRPKQAEWAAAEEHPEGGFDFQVVIMVFNEKRPFQAQLRGKVSLTWSDRRDAQGYLQPKSVVATDWQYLEFVQDPKFPTNDPPEKAES